MKNLPVGRDRELHFGRNKKPTSISFGETNSARQMGQRIFSTSFANAFATTASIQEVQNMSWQGRSETGSLSSSVQIEHLKSSAVTPFF